MDANASQHELEARPFSLTFALQAVARRAGYAVDFDDLHAVLGLSWLFCAVRDEDHPCRWPLYARDAFVIEAARRFGLTLRELHPPQAAHGLRLAPEFDQHFDASYRPIIHHALEHRQPVLAWQGWSGNAGLLWGLIEQACQEGVGFHGRVYSSESRAEELLLVEPPVQLYVIETVTPTQPSPDDLWEAAQAHARLILENKLIERFGIETGPGAFDTWIEMLHTPNPSMEHQPRIIQPPATGSPGPVSTGTPDSANMARAHRALAITTSAAHRSAIRFLQRHRPNVQPRAQATMDTLTHLCRTVVSALDDAAEASDVGSLADSTDERNRLIHRIITARDATAMMRSALTPTP